MMDDFEAGFNSDTEPTKATAPQRQAAPPQQQAPAPVYREPEPDLPEDVANFFDDYPEFEKATEFVKSSIKREIGLDSYISAVHLGAVDSNGRWVDGERDASEVTSTQAFQDWYGSRGYGQCDPATAIKRIREFKSQRGGRGSSSHTTRTSSTDTDFERAFYG